MSKNNLVLQSDGLPFRSSGIWIRRKHYYLREYAKIFTIGMGKKWRGGLTFFDFFAGPGRCLIEQTGEVVDGSPLIALQHSFNKYIFVEQTPALMEALRKRCNHSPKFSSIDFIQEDCNRCINQIIKQMPSGNLNLAFIDPTDIDIHFETIKALSNAPNGVDLLINIQDGMDLKRNYNYYLKQGKNSKLARFLGSDFDITKLKGKEPREVIDIYKSRIRELGYKTVEHRDIPVKNTRNAQMYFLLFASKHPTGLKFWTEISKKDEQGQQEFLYT